MTLSKKKGVTNNSSCKKGYGEIRTNSSPEIRKAGSTKTAYSKSQKKPSTEKTESGETSLQNMKKKLRHFKITKTRAFIRS